MSSTTENPTRQPRLLASPRRGHTGDELVRVVPPLLAALMADVPAQIEHRRLAERYGQLRTRREALSAAIAKAQQQDADEQRQAIREGRPAKAAKAAKVSGELEQVEADLEVLTVMMRESAAQLLAAALPHLREAAAQAQEREERDLDRAGDMLAASLAAFEQAASTAAESGWCAQLIESGEVPPFAERRGGILWKAQGETRAALTRLGEERAAHAAFAANRDEELLEPNQRRSGPDSVKLPPPPASTWVVP